MVIRITILFTVLFLFISCKVKNLYGKDIILEKVKLKDINKIRFDGYYYHKSTYNSKPNIYSLVFSKDGSLIQTDGFEFTSFNNYNTLLLSKEFINIFKDNKSRWLRKYNIKNDTIITQVKEGGYTYEEHVKTNVYKIYSQEKLKNIKYYGLSEYDENQVYFFRKFDSIHKIKEKIKILIK